MKNTPKDTDLVKIENFKRYPDLILQSALTCGTPGRLFIERLTDLALVAINTQPHIIVDGVPSGDGRVLVMDGGALDGGIFEIWSNRFLRDWIDGNASEGFQPEDSAFKPTHFIQLENIRAKIAET